MNGNKGKASPFISYLRSLFVPPEEDTIDETLSSEDKSCPEISIDQETNPFPVTDDAIIESDNKEELDTISSSIASPFVPPNNVSQEDDSVFSEVLPCLESQSEPKTEETHIEEKAESNNADSSLVPTGRITISVPINTSGEDVYSFRRKIKTPSFLSDSNADFKSIPISGTIDKSSNSRYKAPPATIFATTDNSYLSEDNSNTKNAEKKLEQILSANGISSFVTNIICGPSVYRYNVALASGTHVKEVINLHDEIKASMSAESVRIIAPYPGKALVVIEVSRQTKSSVRLRSFIENASYKQSQNLTVPLGINSSDLMPVFHNLKNDSVFLISGFSGSGKTNLVNILICSILCKYSPEEVQFLMIDANELGLPAYNTIPHLLLPVATDYEKAIKTIQYAVDETDQRLKKFTTAHVKNIDVYNDKCQENGPTPLSHILLIIENYHELFRHSKDAGIVLSQLSLKCKNAGVHILITTETASETKIPKSLMQGVSLKASFVQANKKESIYAIGESGAEDLLRHGDMLLRQNTQNAIRIHTPLINESEISTVTKMVKDANSEYERESSTPFATAEKPTSDDELFNEAVEIVIINMSASVSVLQRNLGIGYPRAARLIDELEARGIIGPYTSGQPRKVLMSMEEWWRIRKN